MGEHTERKPEILTPSTPFLTPFKEKIGKNTAYIRIAICAKKSLQPLRLQGF